MQKQAIIGDLHGQNVFGTYSQLCHFVYELMISTQVFMLALRPIFIDNEPRPPTILVIVHSACQSNV